MSNDNENVFRTIEAMLVTAAKKQYGEIEQIVVRIDRQSGEITATRNGEPFDFRDTLEPLYVQVIFQKIRETLRDVLFDEYRPQIGQSISGVVQKYDRGAATIRIGTGAEAIIPKSEQRPGTRYQLNEHVLATVIDVEKAGSRVKIILSQTRT